MCEKEKLFLELIDGFQWKYDADKYPTDLYVFKKNTCLFLICNFHLNQKKFIVKHRLGLEQELQVSYVDINHEKIWSVFEKKFHMNYLETNHFMTNIIKKHFKLKAKLSWTDCLSYTEKHFNNK